jgi:hypothetical protein
MNRKPLSKREAGARRNVSIPKPTEAKMGMQRDADTAEFQREARITLPNAEQQRLWRELQETCFQAIRIAELEVSGIRDGDSYWGGGDVLGGIWGDLRSVVDRLDNAYSWPEPSPEERKRATVAGKTG